KQVVAGQLCSSREETAPCAEGEVLGVRHPGMEGKVACRAVMRRLAKHELPARGHQPPTALCAGEFVEWTSRRKIHHCWRHTRSARNVTFGGELLVDADDSVAGNAEVQRQRAGGRQRVAGAENPFLDHGTKPQVELPVKRHVQLPVQGYRVEGKGLLQRTALLRRQSSSV